MELHQLRYFVAVAELGNFTRAAEKCLVAQPSLSQQIIKLEKELGRPLFDRLGRTVRLTDAGQSLYEQAVSILAAVDDAKRQVVEREDSSGRISIGAIPTIAPYMIPRLLRHFLKRFPQIQITVHENLTGQLVSACRQGDLDLGILALPIGDEQFSSERLFDEELLLAMAADHPLGSQRRITMKDVLAEPFILLNETHCLGEQIAGLCKQQPDLPAVSCYGSQLFTIQELVATGHGVSLIPAMAADADKSKRRVYRSLSGTKPTRTIGIIWHRHRYLSPLVKEFMEFLRQMSH